MGSATRLPSASPPSRMTATTVDGAIIVRIEAPAAVHAPDELVAFPFGLESRAAKALIHNGMLLAARIGRRTYARRSDLLGLVEKLATRRAPSSVVSREDTPEEAYARMVAR